MTLVVRGMGRHLVSRGLGLVRAVLKPRPPKPEPNFGGGGGYIPIKSLIAHNLETVAPITLLHDVKWAK